MSRESTSRDFVPLIALTEKAARALKTDMVRSAHQRGFPDIHAAHDAVFGTLPLQGARSADMAQRAGITRQSMGEVVRDMVGRGLLEMVPDPSDGRAKIVRYTDLGKRCASGGFQHILELDSTIRAAFGDADVDATYRVLLGIVAHLDPEQDESPSAAADGDG